MPALLATLLGALGSVAAKMLVSLMTETFLKKAGVLALEKIANATQTDVDNKLLAAAKEAWGMSDAPAAPAAPDASQDGPA